MKVLAMTDESTLNRQRKYLRWPSQVLSFFRADLTVNDRGQLVKTKKAGFVLETSFHYRYYYKFIFFTYV